MAPYLSHGLRPATHGSRDSATWGQSRQHLKSGSERKRLGAPDAQLATDSNARCVLRSGQRSLNSAPSITQPLVENRNFSDRGTHPTLGPITSTPSQRRRTRTTWRAGCTISCQLKRAVCSAVRSAQFELGTFDHAAIGWKPKFFGPRHTPYTGANHVNTFPATANANDLARRMHN
jgi:hypothetical protein